MSIYIIRKWLYSYICIFFLIQPVIVKIPMILWAIWIIWILHFGKFDQGKKVELQIVLFLFSHFSFCGQKSALWLKISLISFEDLDWRKVYNFFFGFLTVCNLPVWKWCWRVWKTSVLYVWVRICRRFSKEATSFNKCTYLIQCSKLL